MHMNQNSRSRKLFEQLWRKVKKKKREKAQVLITEEETTLERLPVTTGYSPDSPGRRHLHLLSLLAPALHSAKSHICLQVPALNLLLQASVYFFSCYSLSVERPYSPSIYTCRLSSGITSFRKGPQEAQAPP